MYYLMLPQDNLPPCGALNLDSHIYIDVCGLYETWQHLFVGSLFLGVFGHLCWTSWVSVVSCYILLRTIYAQYFCGRCLNRKVCGKCYYMLFEWHVVALYIRNAHNAVFFQLNLSSMSFQYKMSSILLCVLDSIELRLNYDIIRRVGVWFFISLYL
jgi:hypothetical protein